MGEKNRGICTDPDCYNYQKYCRRHPSGNLKEKKPIAPRSKKLATTMRKEYVPQVKEIVEKKTRCSVLSPVCIGEAQGFHHPEGRGENLLKKKIPCCNPCNGWLEVNDAWARANGFKLSRHSPENNKLSKIQSFSPENKTA